MLCNRSHRYGWYPYFFCRLLLSTHWRFFLVAVPQNYEPIFTNTIFLQSLSVWLSFVVFFGFWKSFSLSFSGMSVSMSLSGLSWISCAQSCLGLNTFPVSLFTLSPLMCYPTLNEFLCPMRVRVKKFRCAAFLEDRLQWWIKLGVFGNIK